MEMKAKINFGKIDLYGTGKRYPAEVEIELRQRGGEPTFRMNGKEKKPTGETTPTYLELSICGTVWNSRHSDCVMGGQCLDKMLPYLKHNACFREIYNLWKSYHLNGMNPGTPEQEEAIKAWKEAGNKYDYKAACEYLKSINLYEMPFSGLSVGKRWSGEMYRYGHGWIVNELPGDVVLRVEHIIDAANAQ